MTDETHQKVATGIPQEELRARREHLLTHIRGHKLTGYVLFDEKYVQYFTSFGFLATERPVAFAASTSGEMMVFVPAFEVERAREETDFERIESYPEYPGLEHPMLILGRALRDIGITGAVAADSDGYPGILGYTGPSLSEVLDGTTTDLAPFIESMMVIKSDAEIALIRESARWCQAGHRLLALYSRPGATESQASLRASQEATLEMLETLGSSFGGQQASSDGVSVGFRGQIGRRSAWAHAIAHNIEFRRGDVLVTETSAPIWGYNAELERTMIIGPPSDEARRLFNHMAAAQKVALDSFRPGVTCADVDRAVLEYFEANDLMPYWQQHVGHAIGLRNHEPPFLDIGDHTPIRPGMVFTIEPGVYSSTVGGFRHSDTVVVTADGIDVLTDYPKDIESLTLEL
jgi:Xaa-Pro dipeptidase